MRTIARGYSRQLLTPALVMWHEAHQWSKGFGRLSLKLGHPADLLPFWGQVGAKRTIRLLPSGFNYEDKSAGPALIISVACVHRVE